MGKPIRLKLSRQKGFNLQELSLATNGLPAINVARPSVFSNPFPIGKPSGYLFKDDGDPKPMIDSLSREQAVKFYSELAHGFISPEMHPWGHEWHIKLVAKVGGAPFWWMRSHLRGKNLACWCALDQPCHADVLLLLCEEGR